MIILSEETADSDVRTWNHVTRIDRDSCFAGNVEQITAEMVVGEAIVFLGPFIWVVGLLGRQELSSSG